MKAVLVVALSFSLVACSSGSDQPGSDASGTGPNPIAPSSIAAFGTASVSPARVTTGEVVIVMPAAEVQPVCLDFAIVHRQTASGLERVGALSPNGGWQDYRTGPTPTLPECLPARSAAAVSIVMPPEMGDGSYVICLTLELDEAGCGVVVVEP